MVFMYNIDNIDLGNNIPDGKKEFQGIAHMILQRRMEYTRQSPFTINRNSALKFKGGVL